MDDEQTTICVEARVIGQRKPAEAPWHVALPPAFLHTTADEAHTVLLRDLLAYIVRAEVRAFRVRQEERRLLRVLRPQEISAAASTGKISPGGEQREPAEIDEEAAIQVALQGFLDGIYLVFIDRQQQRDLAGPVQLRPASTLLFIRLVALAGG